MTTLAYVAKRGLRNALRVAAADGGELAALGIEGVHYAFPGGRGMKRHIYFGGVRATLKDDATDGQGDTLVMDTSTVTLYIRVVLPYGGEDDPDDVAEEADRIAESIGDALGAWIGSHRAFCGPGTHASLNFAFGDYSQADTEHASILAYAVVVTGYLSLNPKLEAAA